VSTTTVVPLKRTLGGLTTFMAPAHGPVRAALTFRVGWVDEQLPQHGITHLLEHLILAPLGPPSFTFNGTTGPERVTFICEGTDEQVAWFLTSVAAHVRTLPEHHLELEKNLIRTEACHRTPGVAGRHDLWRWGVQGHGLGCVDELGLDRLTADDLRAWSRSYLTADNAVLWTTSSRVEPLDLARGSRRPVAAPAPWRPHPMPSSFELAGTRVSFSAEVPRGHWAGLLGQLLTRRLLARLRYQQGISYSAEWDVAPIGADSRRLLVSVDGLPDRMQAVATGALHVLHELATTGPTRDELAELAASFRSRRERPEFVLSELERVADDHLTGTPSRAPEHLEAELAALGPQHVAGFVTSMASSMLWSLPPGVVVPGVASAPSTSETRIPGQRFEPARGQVQSSYVQVSDEGLTWVWEGTDPRSVSIRWDECAAVVAYPDGSRRVVGSDGSTVTLFPERWDRWDQLKAAVEGRVPSGRWAPQRDDLERETPRPPLIKVTRTSDAAWITIGAGLLFFTGLLTVTSQMSGLDLTALLVLLPFVGLSCLPFWTVARRRARTRAGTEPVRVRRYRGVASWPTRFVTLALIASSAVCVLAAVGHVWFGAVLAMGATGRAAHELSRRRARAG
jgi:hypothetical protein